MLAHVEDQVAFVDKIAELLRPGGYLMLATQNKFTLSRWSEVVPQAPGQIRKWVDAKELRRLLRPSSAS
jgi:2-polyprenyl-3-methyl-5-hydroxy-6-metoxy-1,4-benzoquinol methylase